MYLKFGFGIFSKNLIANIILIIQLTCSIITLNITLGLYNNVYSKLDVLSGFDRNNTLYGFSENIINSEENSDLTDLLNNADSEPIKYCYMSDTENGSYIYGCAYGKNTSNALKIPLTEGNWYSDSEKDSDTVNAVVMNNSRYSVGNVYDIGMYDLNSGETKTVKFKITGKIDKNTAVIFGVTTSNLINSKVLFSNFNGEDIGADTLFLFDSEDSNISEFLSCTPSLFIYADNETEVQKYAGQFNKFGNIFTMQEIYDNTLNGMKSELHSVFPIAISVLLIGIIGIQCLIVLNTTKNKKMFSIYFICGMKWRDCIKICLGHIMCIFIGALFLVLTIYFVADFTNTFSAVNIMICSNNFLATTGIFALVFIISFLTTRLMLSNSSPVKCLKNE
ncbi:MAG: hypothetical protein PUG48_07755 [Clostridia bacterium]|nr:hypothetical protein [Clostridia bacterium]